MHGTVNRNIVCVYAIVSYKYTYKHTYRESSQYEK